MAGADRFMGIINALAWIIVAAMTAAIAVTAIFIIAGGIKQGHVGIAVMGCGLLLTAPNYYHWYHPTVAWRPAWHTTIAGAGLLMIVAAAMLLRRFY